MTAPADVVTGIQEGSPVTSGAALARLRATGLSVAGAAETAAPFLPELGAADHGHPDGPGALSGATGLAVLEMRVIARPRLRERRRAQPAPGETGGITLGQEVQP